MQVGLTTNRFSASTPPKRQSPPNEILYALKKARLKARYPRYVTFTFAPIDNFSNMGGRVFRSAAVDSKNTKQLEFIDSLGIKRILDLRGIGDNRSLTLPSGNTVDVIVADGKTLSIPSNIRQLRDIIHPLLPTKKNPKGLLIHCSGGVERTGVAAIVTRFLTGHTNNEILEECNKFFKFGPNEKQINEILKALSANDKK